MGSLFKKPKAQKAAPPTAQELSLSRRQDDALSREIEEENRRKKNILRDALGNRSLLGGIVAGGAPSAFSGVSFAGATTTQGTPATGPTAKSLLGSQTTTTFTGSDGGGGGGGRRQRRF